MDYDIAVVGRGPAGMAAALNASVRNKKVIIFGQDSKPLTKSPSVENFLGYEDIKGSDLNEKFLYHVKQRNIEISDEKVINVYAMGKYFNIMLKDNSIKTATSVIIASGLELSKGIKGEEEFIGRGLGYCATCDAALYKGKDVVVIGYNEEAIEDANFIKEIVNKVTFVNMTKTDVSSHIDKDIEVIEEKVKEIKGKFKADTLVLENRELHADGFFVIRDSSKPDRLVPSLKTEKAHVIVNRDMETNIKGLFAAGDITGKPYQLMKAVGEGQVAGLNAASYVTKASREK